jgi:hypothetical protein
MLAGWPGAARRLARIKLRGMVIYQQAFGPSFEPIAPNLSKVSPRFLAHYLPTNLGCGNVPRLNDSTEA